MNQRGFTLIELLLAITMLAVIIGLMGGALSMTYKTMDKAERKMDNLERKKILFSLMESQIQSAFASYYTEQAERKNRFSGKNDAITFASNYSIWRGTRGNCLVTYRIETNEDRKSVLHIEEQILGTDVKQKTVVTTDYDAISFEYYQANEMEEGKWVDQWLADDGGMPEKIRIHFDGNGDKRILSVNVFTQASGASGGGSSKPAVTK